jgi:hypothetical protein
VFEQRGVGLLGAGGKIEDELVEAGRAFKEEPGGATGEIRGFFAALRMTNLIG